MLPKFLSIKIYNNLRKFKLSFEVFFQAIGYTLRCFYISTKGQLPKYEILQLSHRLEKGMLMENPKPFWGWEKAYRLAYLIQINDDEFSNKTGKGVLKAYIDIKKGSRITKEKEQAISFERSNPSINNENTIGGKISLKKADVLISQKDVIEHFFYSKHSCREFQNTIVSKDDILSSISLALRCPSACNRQMTHCYVYQSKEYQTIIITSNIRAFEVSEFNDWLISPSIFAGYLSLSLHLYGIGSCIYRKQIWGHHPYNEEMKMKCKIPNDEIIVLELRFGYYKDTFNVAVSNRHSANDIVSFVGEKFKKIK